LSLRSETQFDELLQPAIPTNVLRTVDEVRTYFKTLEGTLHVPNCN